MKDEGYTSVVGYIATVDIDELAGLCIGFLGESQSMCPEERIIAANLLGDAATVAECSNEHERVRLLRIAEAAIGGVALGDDSTIAALFQRHKTELDRRRRKAMAGIIVESQSVDESATVTPEQPETPSSDAAIVPAKEPLMLAAPNETAIQASEMAAPNDAAMHAQANVTQRPDEEPQVRRRQRDSNGRFSKKRKNGQ